MKVITQETRLFLDYLGDAPHVVFERDVTNALRRTREHYGILDMFVYVAKPTDSDEIKALAKSRLLYHNGDDNNVIAAIYRELD